MKTFKKITSVCLAFLCAAVMMIAGAAMVYADDSIDENVKSTLVTTAEGLTDAIIPLTDENIEDYLNSGDAFTTSAMQSWQSAKEELGEKKDSAGETTVSYSDQQYTVTVPVKFEKADANFVYVFDANGTATSLTVDVQYSMGETLKRAGLNTLMGVGTVFVMLIFLSFLISLFKFIPDPEKKKAEAAKAAKEAQAAAAVAAPVEAAEEELADDGELVAVIAAAIAAAEGTTTDGFVVRSIRKVKRNKR